MTAIATIPEAKACIRDYFTNSGFEVKDEDALDDAARELRDLCYEQGVTIDEVDLDDFTSIIEKYDI